MLLQRIPPRLPFLSDPISDPNKENMSTKLSSLSPSFNHIMMDGNDLLTNHLKRKRAESPPCRIRISTTSPSISSPKPSTLTITSPSLNGHSHGYVSSPSHSEEKERHIKIPRIDSLSSPHPIHERISPICSSPIQSPINHIQLIVCDSEFVIPSSRSPSSIQHPNKSPSYKTESCISPVSPHCPPPPSSSRALQRNTFSFTLPNAAATSTTTSTSIPPRRSSYTKTMTLPTSIPTNSSTTSPSHDPSSSTSTSFSFVPHSTTSSAPTTTRSHSFSLSRPMISQSNNVSPSTRTVQLSPLCLSPRQLASSPPFHALSSPSSSPSLSASPSLVSTSVPALSPVSTQSTYPHSYSSPAIPPSCSPLQSYSPAPGSPSTSRPAHMLHSNLYALSASPAMGPVGTMSPQLPSWKPLNVQALRVRIPEAIGKITLLASTPPDTKASKIREREGERDAALEPMTCHMGRYYAVSTRKGIRRKMEDTYICKPGYTCSNDAFFGVYDGHGRDGQQASEIASRLFSEEFKLCEEFKRGDIMNAFRTCYAQVDTQTVAHVSNGGTTATHIYLYNRTLYVAHVGDSRAMLCRKGQPHILTADHKPHDDIEKARIEAAGGHVIYCATSWRVEGILNISRSIGDGKLKSYVTSTPDVQSLELTEDDDLLIIGTDGMWNVLSCQRVIEIASSYQTPAEASEALARETMQQHSKDNICIMVISLKQILSQATTTWD